ncbi:DNA-processing protein DprA [Fructobacillus americanaquae]|uniref:DNA-processing protein DprA n=1 Tax=Fructobacillus americanaquae TaxID=2940302 RepID=A0ABY5BZZ8_9LACO|nr:DNA-processing protein DprA [Fructobacillus americanaquae]USS92104.1 DNA-processing protein DprA [Fructobacillus americanaquae]
MNLNQFLLALHLTPGLGQAKEAKVIGALSQQGHPEQGPYPWPFLTLALVLGLEPGSQPYRQIQASYEWSLDKALAYQGDWLTYFDNNYPKQLKEVYQPPLVLFYQGDLRALTLPLLAVVGARAAGPYGLAALRQLLPAVLKAGIGVVSGLVKGIDVMAHQMTFHYGGVPVAVIGTGLDRAYPANHRVLQDQVGLQGLLVSEYPVGSLPLKNHFPDRNRIIAGLSSATLVVEAKHHSGSLIIANLALQENRQVLAVPGPINAPLSVGPNELIQAGALPVLTSSDIIRAVSCLT